MRLDTCVSSIVVVCSALAISRPALGAPGHIEIPTVDRHSAPATPAPAAPAGPTVTLEEFLARRRRRIDQIGDTQIVKLRRLLALTADDDPLKPDLWHRLGDLCAEKERAARAEAVLRDEERRDDGR